MVHPVHPVHQPPSNPVGQRRRAGLRITEDYYIGDLDLPVKHAGLNRRLYSSKNRKPQQQQLPSRYRWDAEFQRRTSCPGFQPSYNGGELLDAIDTVGLMTTAETGDDVQQQHRKKKKQQPNPRRHLRRYLTADSALQLTDNGRIATRHQQQQHYQHQSPYHPQAIQVWTTSLMAEFNHIIDGELQRLAATPPSSGALAKRIGPSALSPWARMQLALIDPVDQTMGPQPLPSSDRVSRTDLTSPELTSIQQLSADIDLVERQIFHDLDDLTLTLNQSLPSSTDGSGGGAPTDGTTGHLPSPLLVSL